MSEVPLGLAGKEATLLEATKELRGAEEVETL